MTNAISKVAGSVKNWWVFLIIGILMILGSIWLFKTPIGGFSGIIMFFSMLIFISGLLSIFYAFSNKDDIDNWGLFLAGGILDIVVGFLLMKYPAKAVLLFSVFIGFWLLFRGISTISTSFKFKKEGESNWFWILLFGILITGFAVMAILYKPLLGGAYLAYMLAFAFFFIGVANIFISLKLKDVKSHLDDGKDMLEDAKDDIASRLKK